MKGKTAQKGFFNSPLFLGFLSLVPIFLVMVGVIGITRNLRSEVERNSRVLGTKTVGETGPSEAEAGPSEAEAGVRVEIKDRIEKLRELLKKVDSEGVREEIERLEKMLE